MYNLDVASYFDVKVRHKVIDDHSSIQPSCSLRDKVVIRKFLDFFSLYDVTLTTVVLWSFRSQTLSL